MVLQRCHFVGSKRITTSVEVRVHARIIKRSLHADIHVYDDSENLLKIKPFILNSPACLNCCTELRLILWQRVSSCDGTHFVRKRAHTQTKTCLLILFYSVSLCVSLLHPRSPPFFFIKFIFLYFFRRTQNMHLHVFTKVSHPCILLLFVWLFTVTLLCHSVSAVSTRKERGISYWRIFLTSPVWKAAINKKNSWLNLRWNSSKWWAVDWVTDNLWLK